MRIFWVFALCLCALPVRGAETEVTPIYLSQAKKAEVTGTVTLEMDKTLTRHLPFFVSVTLKSLPNSIFRYRTFADKIFGRGVFLLAELTDETTKVASHTKFPKCHLYHRLQPHNGPLDECGNNFIHVLSPEEFVDTGKSTTFLIDVSQQFSDISAGKYKISWGLYTGDRVIDAIGPQTIVVREPTPDEQRALRELIPEFKANPTGIIPWEKLILQKPVLDGLPDSLQESKLDSLMLFIALKNLCHDHPYYAEKGLEDLFHSDFGPEARCLMLEFLKRKGDKASLEKAEKLAHSIQTDFPEVAWRLDDPRGLILRNILEPK